MTLHPYFQPNSLTPTPLPYTNNNKQTNKQTKTPTRTRTTTCGRNTLSLTNCNFNLITWMRKLRGEAECVTIAGSKSVEAEWHSTTSFRDLACDFGFVTLAVRHWLYYILDGMDISANYSCYKAVGSIPLRLSFVFKKVVVCGRCLVTLSITSCRNIKMVLIAAHLNAGVILVTV